MSRDRYERKHRRAARHSECVGMMAEADFAVAPSLPEAMGLEGKIMWGIWDRDAEDWVRELPSKVDDGGLAVLAFEDRREARKRAAKHFGFDTYTEAKEKDWCDVRRISAEY